jgi:hypothetical protein
MAANPEASVSIDAPLKVVWDVMLDTERYAEWNPFVERVECPAPPQVGDPIVLHVRWANGKQVVSPERITALEPPSTDSSGITTAMLAYNYEGWPSKAGLVRGRRIQRLTQRPGEPTAYDTVEEFSGAMVRFAGPARVADGFRRHAAALKERAESLA